MDNEKLKEQGVMLINVDPLAFTVPIQIDNERFMVNVFHKEHGEDLYGIIIIKAIPTLEFTVLRNDKFLEPNPTVENALNVIKQYVKQTIKINGEALKFDNSIQGSIPIEINIGMDIQNNGPDGKPILDEFGKVVKKHVEINKKLN